MPLYLIRRPAGNAAEVLRNSAGLQSALINAASPAAAITAADILAAARGAGQPCPHAISHLRTRNWLPSANRVKS